MLYLSIKLSATFIPHLSIHIDLLSLFSVIFAIFRKFRLYISCCRYDFNNTSSLSSICFFIRPTLPSTGVPRHSPECHMSFFDDARYVIRLTVHMLYRYYYNYPKYKAPSQRIPSILMLYIYIYT